MSYFILKWNAGCGESVEILECETQEEAQECAYDYWREEAECNANYSAEPYSDKEAVDCDLVEEAKDLDIYKKEE